MRVLVLLLCLAACGRVGFDRATGGDDTGIDAEAPIPDAASFTAPCDVAVRIADADVATPLAAAAAGGSYRATWVDSNRVMHVVAIERVDQAIAVTERTFAASAFLPTPMGSDIAIAGGNTVSIMWGTTQTEIRRLVGPPLGTGRSTAYGALVTELSAFGDQMALLRTGGDLTVERVNPVELSYSQATLVEMQMTERERVFPMPDGLLVTAARPNGDDCDVYAYDANLALLGASPVPSDANACERIVAASTATSRMIAYEYLAGQSEIRMQAITRDATVGAMMPITPGTEPELATDGTTFLVGFRPLGGGPYEVKRVTPALIILGSQALSPTPVRSVALASSSGEVVALYATATELFLRRFCSN